MKVFREDARTCGKSMRGRANAVCETARTLLEHGEVHVSCPSEETAKKFMGDMERFSGRVRPFPGNLKRFLDGEPEFAGFGSEDCAPALAKQPDATTMDEFADEWPAQTNDSKLRTSRRGTN